MATGLCRLDASGRSCGSESRSWRDGKAGRDDEPDLRVLGESDGFPPLPDTEYLLCYDPSSNNELAQVIYQAMESYHNPWQYSPMSAPEGDDSDR